jgi:hypothetical protein
MAVNINRLKKFAKSQKSIGEYITVADGETLVYVHSQCREDDKYEPTEGLNVIPIVQHYSIGPENKIALGLDSDTNPIIEHPFVKRYLKQSKNPITLTGECPILAAIESGELSDEDADECKPTKRFVWGITPLAHRQSNADEWSPLPAEPGVAILGKMVSDGILDQYCEHGDISDVDGAIFLRIVKSGKGMKTRYEVKPDGESLKKPKKLDKKLRAKLAAAMKPGGACDLFKVVSHMIKSPDEIEAALAGVPMSDERDDDEKPRGRSGRRSRAVATRVKSRPKPANDNARSDEDEDELEDEDEAANDNGREDDDDLGLEELEAELQEEDEEEEEEEEEAEEEEEETYDDGDEEGEEDDDEDEEEDEPVRPARKAKRKVATRKVATRKVAKRKVAKRRRGDAA